MSIYETHSTLTHRTLMHKSKADLARMVLEYADMNAAVLKGKREVETDVKRLREALTGWSGYGWKDGAFVDELQELFDAILAGRDVAWAMAHRNDWMYDE